MVERWESSNKAAAYLPLRVLKQRAVGRAACVGGEDQSSNCTLELLKVHRGGGRGVQAQGESGMLWGGGRWNGITVFQTRRWRSAVSGQRPAPLVPMTYPMTRRGPFPSLPHLHVLPSPGCQVRPCILHCLEAPPPPPDQLDELLNPQPELKLGFGLRENRDNRETRVIRSGMGVEGVGGCMRQCPRSSPTPQFCLHALLHFLIEIAQITCIYGMYI